MTNKTNTNIKKKCLQNCNNNGSSFFLKPVDELEIRKIIVTLKNTQATGYDEIRTQIIKDCRYSISLVLAHMINLSFEKGTFPEKLKRSIVKPLYKKGDRDTAGNYRPVTLIPIFSKIFEKAMASRLSDYFYKQGTIKKEQFGFQK